MLKMKSDLLVDVVVDVTVLFLVLERVSAVVNIRQDGDHRSYDHDDAHEPPIRYTRDALLMLQSATKHQPDQFDSFPTEMTAGRHDSDSYSKSMNRRRKRGHRGGVRRRLRRNRANLPLPSIIMANTRSLRPKPPNFNFDELCANVTYMHEYRNASLLCFSETWFCEDISDESVYIDGFGAPFRCDRNLTICGKNGGGGVCIYVNEQYCHRANVTVKKTLCTPDLELITLSLRPKYLPREFGQVFVTVIYSHPRASTTNAAADIADVIHSLQSVSPDAPNFILGDFNSCDLKKTLSSFKQYVTCNTRLNNMPDRCYGNIPQAYKSVAMPEIGKSDHQAIHLIPSYQPVIKSNPVVKKSVKVWSSESVEELRACYECTEWNVFLDSSESVDEATNVISDYIMFCEDMIIPTKEIKIFPNNKPWITKSLKQTINKKKAAFQKGNRGERKEVQKILRQEIKKAKIEYREKVEEKFQAGNMRDAWKGLKILTGQNKPQQTATMSKADRTKHADSLNDFYCRFERDDLKEKLTSVIEDIKKSATDDDENDLEIHSSAVMSIFSKQKVNKAVGPDRICGKLLRNCAAQLSHVFSLLFSWSLRDCVVPTLWKNSIISPVPKSRNPKELNDFRPVALTSIVMKCFERVVLQRLLNKTQHAQDPLQFAYKQDRSTDDATLTLLHNAYTHLDKPRSFVRILFIDFSSAFNTIQPHLMALKLLKLNVCPKLILWIIDFLVQRSQTVCFQGSLSQPHSTSTGSPQGTVLSPVLFTLYTNDCFGTDLTPVIKYSDDTAIQDLSNSHTTFIQQVEHFTDWCRENFLDLNVKKTKEMIVDFRREPSAIPDLFINNCKVERVNEYKYLGTKIDNKLNFDANTQSIQKKCQSRLYCLQKLRSIGVNRKILANFYRCFIESVLIFGSMCWYAGLSVKNRNVLERVVRVCGKVVGERQRGMNELYACQVVRKARMIVNDRTHVLAKYFELLPSGRRYRTLRNTTKRARMSFVSRAIELLNERA